jgi:hypothetical protein
MANESGRAPEAKQDCLVHSNAAETAQEQVPELMDDHTGRQSDDLEKEPRVCRAPQVASRYPTPRTVWSKRGRPLNGSSFRRRSAM